MQIISSLLKKIKFKKRGIEEIIKNREILKKGEVKIIWNNCCKKQVIKLFNKEKNHQRFLHPNTNILKLKKSVINL